MEQGREWADGEAHMRDDGKGERAHSSLVGVQDGELSRGPLA